MAWNKKMFNAQKRYTKYSNVRDKNSSKKSFKKRFSKRKEEFKKYPWFLPDREWKTFITFYEKFVNTKKNFHHYSFINTLELVVLSCQVFYELPLNERKQAHISGNDELHVKRFGSSSRSHMALKNSLFLGVIKRVDADISKRSPNCLYYVKKQFYVSLKKLYGIMSKWNEKLYQQFVSHYNEVHKKWLMEKSQLVQKQNCDKNKKLNFFDGMELSAEGVLLNGFMNRKKVENFKIDFNKVTEVKPPDTSEVLEMLNSLISSSENKKDNIEFDKTLLPE